MSFRIPHIFSEKLNKTSDFQSIKILFIGTFNPGRPKFANWPKTLDREAFDDLEERNPNFYFRSNNRFWGILDRVYFPEEHKNETKRATGLKYYKEINTIEETVIRQKEFCLKNQIFITDIIAEINPASFEGIYNGYQDTVLDRIVSEWNTENIIGIIDKYNPDKILFTFKPSNQIPNISLQVNSIFRKNSEKTHFLMSPSGNSKKKYTELVEAWRKHLVE